MCRAERIQRTGASGWRTPGDALDQPGKDVPVGVAAFNEVMRPPRELCEPHFDIRRFTVMERGGHFPAMEVPGDLVGEIRAFFRPLREVRDA